jgi:hypothetical protein
MSTPEVESLLAEQSSSGGFRSFVHLGLRIEEDWNLFTTALVLRSLAVVDRDDERLSASRERALDYVSGCESRAQPGAFGFWPRDSRPAWVNDLPEDADDTAICTLELLRYGRRDKKFAKRAACLRLVKHRLESVDPPAPCWLRPGVFVTWLGDRSRRHAIDCCVNANVVALLAGAGLSHLPGYREACSMIEDAIVWATDSKIRLSSITPFYPDPDELLHAIEHAVGWGAAELGPAMAKLRGQLSTNVAEFHRDRPICSNAYGAVYWTSPAVQIARQLSRTGGVSPRLTHALADATARMATCE